MRKKIAIIILLFLFGIPKSFCQNKNDISIGKIDSLINAHQYNQVVLDLSYLNKDNLKSNEIPLYIKFIEALEKADFNEIALQNSIEFLNKKFINNHLKSKLHIINARLYEKAGNGINTKKSLDSSYKNFDRNTPDEIIQEWNVRMASYYRVFFDTKDDSALYYAQKALKFNAGEIGSAYFLNAFLADNLEEQVSYFQKSIEYFEKVNDIPALGGMYINLAEAYFDHDQFKLYEENLLKGINILKKQNNLDDKVNLYETLKDYYNYKQNYKYALLYSDSLIVAQKKVDSVYNFTAVSLLERKYENENLQEEISRAKELINQKVKTEKAERTKSSILTLLFGISLIFIGIVIHLIFRIRIKHKKLSLKSVLLNDRNAELRKLAKYNALLMKETNHRVKNNLAMLAGIIRIKISRTDNPEFIKKLTEIEGRINSIASIHKNLYQSDNYAELNIKSVLFEIIDNQKHMVNPDLKENIHFSIEDFQLDMSKMLPLTLIVNELLTNSVKYALKSTEDYIKIVLKHNVHNATIELNIEDSGSGFDFSVENTETQSVGVYLVKLLARQLKAELTFKKGHDSFCTRLIFKT